MDLNSFKLWDTFINRNKWDSSQIHSNEDYNNFIKDNGLQKEREIPVKTAQKEILTESVSPDKTGTILKFTCVIREQRYGLSTNQKQNSNQAHGIIFDDRFEFIKKGVFLKSDLGERKVHYRNVISIDLDKSGYLHAMSNVNVRMRDGEVISLGATAEICETIYRFMYTKWNIYQENNDNPEPTQTVVQEKPDSDADELLKYAELYEKGLLTKEEFDVKKKELL